ncbi:MAG: DUF3108 domain-containing protein [Pseudomonadota bacterium]
MQTRQTSRRAAQRLLACTSFAAFLLGGMQHAGAEPTPYRAVYKANYKGVPISATGIRELRRIDEDEYLLTSSAKSFIASIDEQTRIRFDSTKAVIPIEYQYHRTGLGKNRSDVLTFDWDAARARQGDQWSLDLVAGVQDKLSYQLEMRDDLVQARDLGAEWPEMHYQVAENGALREYVFRVVGEESVDTPAGVFSTIKATRVRENSSRVTNFWLAPDYDFMLVRFEQIEDNGRGFTLLLKEAEFNGEPL